MTETIDTTTKYRGLLRGLVYTILSFIALLTTSVKEATCSFS